MRRLHAELKLSITLAVSRLFASYKMTTDLFSIRQSASQMLIPPGASVKRFPRGSTTGNISFIRLDSHGIHITRRQDDLHDFGLWSMETNWSKIWFWPNFCCTNWKLKQYLSNVFRSPVVWDIFFHGHPVRLDDSIELLGKVVYDRQNVLIPISIVAICIHFFPNQIFRSTAFKLAFPEASDSEARAEARKIEDIIIQRCENKVL